MNKKLKRVLIIAGIIIAAALFMHLAVTYLIPFIAQMHNGGAY
jgi:hypothetical protein